MHAHTHTKHFVKITKTDFRVASIITTHFILFFVMLFFPLIIIIVQLFETECKDPDLGLKPFT